MLYWFALRSRVGALPFAVGLVSYTFLNVPDMLIRARIFAAAIDATAESSLSLFVEALKDSNVIIVTIMLIIAAPATTYIHSTHIRLLSEGSLFTFCLTHHLLSWFTSYSLCASLCPVIPALCRRKEETSSVPSADIALGDRAARRARVLEQQNTGIIWGVACVCPDNSASNYANFNLAEI